LFVVLQKTYTFTQQTQWVHRITQQLLSRVKGGEKERPLTTPQDDGSGREEERRGEGGTGLRRVLPLSYTFRKESDVTNRRTPSSMTRTKNTTNPIEASQRGVRSSE
jgi:hypothetical protein